MFLQFIKKSHILWALLALLILELLLAASKGFDFTDEGLYCLVTNPFQNNFNNPINYDIFYKYIYNFTGYEFDIITLRILRIILSLFGSTILFFGLKEFINQQKTQIKNTNLLFPFLLLAGFWNYLPFLIQSPGYGFHHFFALQLFSGGLLYLTFYNKRQFILIIFSTFLIASGVFISWLSKPTGVPGMLLLLIYMVCVIKRKNRLKDISILLAMFSTFYVLFFVVSPFAYRITPSAYAHVLKILEADKNSHSVQLLSVGLLRDFILFITAMLAGLATAYLIKIKKNYLVVTFLSLLFLGAIFEVFTSINRYKLTDFAPVRSFVIYRIFIYIPLFLAFLVGLLVSFNRLTRDNIIIACFFVIVETCYVFGSNVSNLYSVVTCLQFMLIATLIVFPWKFVPKLILISSSFLIVAISIMLFVPYRQENIWTATFEYKYGKNKSRSIFLNKGSYNNQRNFDEVVAHYKTNHIIGYTRMLGNIYLSGKTSPGSLLWGEEDVKTYFKYRFNKPDNFLLFLEDKNAEPYIKVFLKDYKVTPGKTIKWTNSHNNKTFFYAYFCKKMKPSDIVE